MWQGTLTHADAYYSNTRSLVSMFDAKRLFPSGGVNHLYENKGGGRFESAANAGTITTDCASSYSAAWGDYDGDGDLDLFVANYNGPLMRGCV